jgi:hypothetical protein
MKLDHFCDVCSKHGVGGFGTLATLPPDRGRSRGPISLHTLYLPQPIKAEVCLRAALALLRALIHQSAWKEISPKEQVIYAPSASLVKSKQQRKYGHLAYRHIVLAPRYLGCYSTQGRRTPFFLRPLNKGGWA